MTGYENPEPVHQRRHRLLESEPDRQAVLDIAFRYRATVYDSVYVALSIAKDAKLLTAERTTTPWVVKLGDMVENVRG